MKKKLILLLILATSMTAFSKGFIVKLGSTRNPHVKFGTEDAHVYDETSNLTLEAMGAMSDYMDIGFGVEFNNQLEKNGRKLNIGYRPVYVNIKRRYGDSDATVFPYSITRFGLTFPVDYDKDDNLEAKNGLHLGLGAGIEFNHFLFELTGTYNGFKTDGTNDFITDGQTHITKVTFSFGYRFGGNYGEKRSSSTRSKAVRRETPTVIEEETKPATETKQESDEVYDELLNPENEDALSRQKYIESRIEELNKLKEQGIITDEEYQAEKELILNQN